MGWAGAGGWGLWARVVAARVEVSARIEVAALLPEICVVSVADFTQDLSAQI